VPKPKHSWRMRPRRRRSEQPGATIGPSTAARARRSFVASGSLSPRRVLRWGNRLAASTRWYPSAGTAAIRLSANRSATRPRAAVCTQVNAQTDQDGPDVGMAGDLAQFMRRSPFDIFSTLRRGTIPTPPASPTWTDGRLPAQRSIAQSETELRNDFGRLACILIISTEDVRSRSWTTRRGPIGRNRL
jgi:hypothetical protein